MRKGEKAFGSVAAFYCSRSTGSKVASSSYQLSGFRVLGLMGISIAGFKVKGFLNVQISISGSDVALKVQSPV